MLCKKARSEQSERKGAMSLKTPPFCFHPSLSEKDFKAKPLNSFPSFSHPANPVLAYAVDMLLLMEN